MKQKEEQITQWIEIYSKALLNRALYLVSDKEDAADIVQEVFLVAYTSFDSFQGKSSPLTWLYNILRNKIADFYRSKYKNPVNTNLSDFFDKEGSWADQSVLNFWQEISENSSEKEDFSRVLEECIEKLPPRWKILVKLYYLEEKKTEVVCQEMEISTTNLWKILQRSRLQLRKCLEINWFGNV
ncbi:RNA polymerase subunit sigma [Capnocytophaga stomatis]|uniref:RNA polymerase subunit sigma n=1 Tax=Capnocytophaga stomatis TaxID=1848904 RepID=A0A250FU06_9FLAO|nr:sigma-70 family RNA polymerase sigma factor [Capnocytophaga stomatis]ATA88600.1 RNA polymerase subunit sigma [Capnocytophaga stomatis]GIM50245.1 DNA-directed RNA polymerase sigma-70 factor [Capnocytophaga stomatis]